MKSPMMIKRLLKWIPTLLLFLLPLLIKEQYFIHFFTMILFYTSLGEAWNIIGGYAGQPFFGASAFLGIGAYTSTILYVHYNTSPWLGMFIGAIIACICAVLIGIPCFKLHGPFFALATLSFLIISERIALSLRGLTGGAYGISIPLKGDSLIDFQFNLKTPYYYIALVFTLLIIFCVHRIENSKLGLYLVALREDEEAANSIGINTLKYKLIAFIISAFITAIFGTFYAQFFRYIDPYSILSVDLSFEIILIALFGGAGTLFGPIFGSLILVSSSEFMQVTLGGKLPGLHLIIYGILVLLLMRFSPRGILYGLKSLISRAPKHFKL